MITADPRRKVSAPTLDLNLHPDRERPSSASLQPRSFAARTSIRTIPSGCRPYRTWPSEGRTLCRPHSPATFPRKFRLCRKTIRRPDRQRASPPHQEFHATLDLRTRGNRGSLTPGKEDDFPAQAKLPGSMRRCDWSRRRSTLRGRMEPDIERARSPACESTPPGPLNADRAAEDAAESPDYATSLFRKRETVPRIPRSPSPIRTAEGRGTRARGDPGTPPSGKAGSPV